MVGVLHGVATTLETQIFLRFDSVSVEVVVSWSVVGSGTPRGEGSGGGAGNGGGGGGMKWQQRNQIIRRII